MLGWLLVQKINDFSAFVLTAVSNILFNILLCILNGTPSTFVFMKPFVSNVKGESHLKKVGSKVLVSVTHTKSFGIPDSVTVVGVTSGGTQLQHSHLILLES